MLNFQHKVSRRERQILDVLYRKSRATAAEVHQEIPNRPSYSTVRALLRVLEEKGLVRHEIDGPRYVYVPAVAPEKARRSALQHLVETFFQGSAGKAMAALLDDAAGRLSPEELDRMARMIERARKEGR